MSHLSFLKLWPLLLIVLLVATGCRSSRSLRGERFVLVVDAGHGGNMPGATIGGQCEKDIDLAIVLQLKQIFEENPDSRIGVYYTRVDDTNPSYKPAPTTSSSVSTTGQAWPTSTGRICLSPSIPIRPRDGQKGRKRSFILRHAEVVANGWLALSNKSM